MPVATARQLLAYCSDRDGVVIAPYHGYTVRLGQRVGVLHVDRTPPFGKGGRHQVTVDSRSSPFYGPASDACQGVLDRLPFEPPPS